MADSTNGLEGQQPWYQQPLSNGLRRLVRALKIWLTYAVLMWKSQMEYRGAFFMGVVAHVVGYGTEVLTLWILISRFGSLGVWTADEATLLYSIYLLTYAIAAFVFYAPMVSIPDQVVSGVFDQNLVKPWSPLSYTVMSGFSTGYISHASLSVIILIWSANAIGIEWSWIKLISLIALVIGGAMLQSAILLWFGGISIWVLQSRSLAQLFWHIRNFVRYPLSIYPVALRILLTVVLPFGFINFYPTQYLIGKSDFGMFPAFFQYLTLPVGILVLYAMVYFFNGCLNRYQSTGS